MISIIRVISVFSCVAGDDDNNNDDDDNIIININKTVIN